MYSLYERIYIGKSIKLLNNPPHDTSWEMNKIMKETLWNKITNTPYFPIWWIIFNIIMAPVWFIIGSIMGYGIAYQLHLMIEVL